jgi:hypothetical protein
MPFVITPATDPALLGDAVTGSTEGHVEVGLRRLIERWKGKPNVEAFLRSYLEEIQELEEAIWFVMFGRLPDYAEGVHLDNLGKIVGRARDGMPDELFRVYIKAQIRVNRSNGTTLDLIEILQLIETAAFRLVEFPTASFLIYFLEPPSSGYSAQAIPKLVKAGRAAGVSGLVTYPTDADRGAFFGAGAYDPTLNAARGFSSSYDPTIGGLFGHAARA